jgi:hypothetical protein
VIEDGKVLIKNQKLCIPGPVQEKVINLVHQGNQGVQKTKELIRIKVWFPGINKRVEQIIQNCLLFQARTKSHKKEPVVMCQYLPVLGVISALDFYTLRPMKNFLWSLTTTLVILKFTVLAHIG